MTTNSPFCANSINTIDHCKMFCREASANAPSILERTSMLSDDTCCCTNKSIPLTFEEASAPKLDRDVVKNRCQVHCKAKSKTDSRFDPDPKISQVTTNDNSVTCACPMALPNHFTSMMTDTSKKYQTQRSPPATTKPAQEEAATKPNKWLPTWAWWLILGIGIVIILAVIVGFVMYVRGRPRQAGGKRPFRKR